MTLRDCSLALPIPPSGSREGRGRRCRVDPSRGAEASARERARRRPARLSCRGDRPSDLDRRLGRGGGWRRGSDTARHRPSRQPLVERAARIFIRGSACSCCRPTACWAVSRFAIPRDGARQRRRSASWARHSRPAECGSWPTRPSRSPRSRRTRPGHSGSPPGGPSAVGAGVHHGPFVSLTPAARPAEPRRGDGPRGPARAAAVAADLDDVRASDPPRRNGRGDFGSEPPSRGKLRSNRHDARYARDADRRGGARRRRLAQTTLARLGAPKAPPREPTTTSTGNPPAKARRCRGPGTR